MHWYQIVTRYWLISKAQISESEGKNGIRISLIKVIKQPALMFVLFRKGALNYQCKVGMTCLAKIAKFMENTPG